ncbi:MAG: DUF354 domain-containing protein [Candidatus Methanofastidiosa archaeon]|nr:DUF354 domain-containing protein [Candidatus Methanofastidiosa archaeon]
MNVLIDIIHPAHLNLFKRVIFKLHEEGHNVIVTCINRGKIPKIVKAELAPVPVFVIGRHRGSTLSILVEANIIRFFLLFFFIVRRKVDVGISFGSFLMGAVLTILGKPNIHLCDDPERKLNAVLENLTCRERYLPPIIEPKGKVRTFNALKEWAYLSPRYFRPVPRALEPFNVSPKDYIFIREVSTGSLNYKGQQTGLVGTFANKLDPGLKVIFSLEDKSLINRYPKSWILLEEPVKDIQSLIYFSKMVISSGDSMAREGAMLGVPGIYCGKREMTANNLLMDKGMLFKVPPQECPEFVTSVIKGKIKVHDQSEFRNHLLDEWEDVTEFLLQTIKKYQKK